MPVVFFFFHIYFYPDLFGVQVATTQTNQYEANLCSIHKHFLYKVNVLGLI